MTACECGCGKEVLPGKRFVVGHNFNIRKLMPRVCPVCQKTFQPRTHETKCCSAECSYILRGATRRARVTKKCPVCGKSFEVRKYRDETAKYCSKECWSVRNPPVAKICGYCGKSFTDWSYNNAKFCSKACADKNRSIEWRGERAPAWKGGKSLKNDRARMGNSLAHWRKAVFMRDRYTCQKCGHKGSGLQAHHIKPFIDFPELRLDVSNGITLCLDCHEAIHGHKINSGKFPHHCIDCGKETSGRGFYCRSCGTRHQWERRRQSNHPPKEPASY